MNLRAILIVALLGSILVLGYQAAYRVPKIGQEYSGLVAEYNSLTSDGSMAGTMVKSLFDGLTLGNFAEDGIFTEANKRQRLDAHFAKRRAELQVASAHAVELMRYSVIILVVSIAGLIWFAPAKVNEEEVAD